jgi:hypothetical protein
MWLRGDELLEFRFVAQRLKVGVLRRSCGEFGIERERLFEHLKRLLRFSRPRQEAREVELRHTRSGIQGDGLSADGDGPCVLLRLDQSIRVRGERANLPNSEDAPQLLNGLFVVVHAQVAYRSVPA